MRGPQRSGARGQRAAVTLLAAAALLAAPAVEAVAGPPAATPAISVSTPTAMAILVVQRIRIRIGVPFRLTALPRTAH